MISLAAVIPALFALLLVFQAGAYPTATPALPSPTPSPGQRAPLPQAPQANQPAAARRPAAAPAGPLAKLNWLVGTWTCNHGTTATFAQGKNELTGTTTGPDVSSASSLIYDQGRWVWNALIATRTVTSPVQLLGEDVDVTATYLDLKGEVSLPDSQLGTRVVRRKTGPGSYTEASYLRIGDGDWQPLPVRTCKRK